jgi:hypothetical protein
MLETINRKNIGDHLFDYQLELIGKKRIETLDVENWRFTWTLTRNQYDIFRDYTIKLCKKTFKYNRQRAISTFEWFYHEFGLRIKD